MRAIVPQAFNLEQTAARPDNLLKMGQVRFGKDLLSEERAEVRPVRRLVHDGLQRKPAIFAERVVAELEECPVTPELAAAILILAREVLKGSNADNSVI